MAGTSGVAVDDFLPKRRSLALQRQPDRCSVRSVASILLRARSSWRFTIVKVYTNLCAVRCAPRQTVAGSVGIEDVVRDVCTPDAVLVLEIERAIVVCPSHDGQEAGSTVDF